MTPSEPHNALNADGTTSDPETRTPFNQLGGDDGIRRIVDRFYDLMDTAPEAIHVRALHAASLKSSREKLRLFLTGWTGGPPVYTEQYGHPRLRMRHFPFAIGALERDEWQWCMDRSLLEQPMSDALRSALQHRLHDLADHMRNQPEGDERHSLPTQPI